MSLSFGQASARRRMSLTPMIDIVFLLLVFFMLAAGFSPNMKLPLTLGGSTGTYAGPPRLVEIHPEGARLNGVATPPDALANALGPLMATPDDAIVLRARGGAQLQDVTRIMDLLTAAGFTTLVLVE